MPPMFRLHSHQPTYPFQTSRFTRKHFANNFGPLLLLPLVYTQSCYAFNSTTCPHLTLQLTKALLLPLFSAYLLFMWTSISVFRVSVFFGTVSPSIWMPILYNKNVLYPNGLYAFWSFPSAWLWKPSSSRGGY